MENYTRFEWSFFQLKHIVEWAKDHKFTTLMVVNERFQTGPSGETTLATSGEDGVVLGLYICSLPHGPTAYYRLTSLKLGGFYPLSVVFQFRV